MPKPPRPKRRPEVTVSNEPLVQAGGTTGPDATGESTVSAWRDRESTNAPVVGEIEPSGQYSAGYPELLEKFLQHRVPFSSRSVVIIVIVMWFAFVSWLFVQDNGSGVLADRDGLEWFAVKAGVYSVLLVVCGGMIAAVLKVIAPPEA